MSRVPTSMRVALVVVLALGPGSAVPCSAIHVLLPVEIIDQSITSVKPRVESLVKNTHAAVVATGSRGVRAPRHSSCEARPSTGACRRAVRVRVSVRSKGLGTSSAGAALHLHTGARRGRSEALGGAGRQRHGIESAELLVVEER